MQHFNTQTEHKHTDPWTCRHLKGGRTLCRMGKKKYTDVLLRHVHVGCMSTVCANTICERREGPTNQNTARNRHPSRFLFMLMLLFELTKHLAHLDQPTLVLKSFNHQKCMPCTSHSRFARTQSDRTCTHSSSSRQARMQICK